MGMDLEGMGLGFRGWLIPKPQGLIDGHGS
jgi:hypothetical protein